MFLRSGPWIQVFPLQIGPWPSFTEQGSRRQRCSGEVRPRRREVSGGTGSVRDCAPLGARNRFGVAGFELVDVEQQRRGSGRRWRGCSGGFGLRFLGS